MPFGDSTTDKELELGWSRGVDDEQFFQRLLGNLRQIDAQLHNQFAHNPKQDLGLKFAVFGGTIQTATEWTFVGPQTITLPDGATSFVERGTGGAILANQTEFTFENIPIAEVRTKTGLIELVTDRRPELGEPAGGAAVSITFAEIIGVILDSQVPLSAVKQHEGSLAIDFTQLTGVATRAQLPPEIAYEDEANTFGPLQTIPQLEAPNLEALLRFIGNSDR